MDFIGALASLSPETVSVFGVRLRAPASQSRIARLFRTPGERRKQPSLRTPSVREALSCRHRDIYPLPTIHTRDTARLCTRSQQRGRRTHSNFISTAPRRCIVGS